MRLAVVTFLAATWLAGCAGVGVQTATETTPSQGTAPTVSYAARAFTVESDGQCGVHYEDTGHNGDDRPQWSLQTVTVGLTNPEDDRVLAGSTYEVFGYRSDGVADEPCVPGYQVDVAPLQTANFEVVFKVPYTNDSDAVMVVGIGLYVDGVEVSRDDAASQ